MSNTNTKRRNDQKPPKPPKPPKPEPWQPPRGLRLVKYDGHINSIVEILETNLATLESEIDGDHNTLNGQPVYSLVRTGETISDLKGGMLADLRHLKSVGARYRAEGASDELIAENDKAIASLERRIDSVRTSLKLKIERKEKINDLIKYIRASQREYSSALFIEVPVKLPVTATEADLVTERKKRAKAVSELEDIRFQDRPKADAKKIIKEKVAALRKKGRNLFDMEFAYSPDRDAPTQIDIFANAKPEAMMLQLLAAVVGDPLEQLLLDQADAHYDVLGEPMPADARAKRMAELQTQIEDADWRIEGIFQVLQAQGKSVARESGVSIWPILGLKSVRPLKPIRERHVRVDDL